MRILSYALSVGVVASAIYAFVPIATRADAPSPVPSTVASPSGTTVDTKNFAYAPATISVHPGDTVTFKNSDSTAHTVTASDKSFDSGNMDQGATWSHVFAKAGTYAYVCSYHTYMQGTIVVK